MMQINENKNPGLILIAKEKGFLEDKARIICGTAVASTTGSKTRSHLRLGG